MILKQVEIHKYKAFNTNQNFEVEDNVTILVGMNESGKTATLEAIAKTNYFQDDDHFKFNITHDYPRKEKKRDEKSGKNLSAITCIYEIDATLMSKIASDMGEGFLKTQTYKVTTNYKNDKVHTTLDVDKNSFINFKTSNKNVSSDKLNKSLSSVTTLDELKTLKSEYTDEKYIGFFEELEVYFKNDWKCSTDCLQEYVTRVYLHPNQPKFLYYDDYFALPSRISIEKLNNDELEGNDNKTAKALFELAEINTAEIVNSDNFEDFIAELEATEAIISDELFKYWKTNKNLKVVFRIDKIQKTHVNNTQIVEHVLDIRVKNKGVSLPLRSRSKGFNWFFSFLVWFKRIQEDTSSKYILLLDEPGLNLHAAAQADLLRFIENLSDNYQIIYTTHSPFMIKSENLNRVRTVLETDDCSIISDSIQQNDPNTLFPLQAALGYDIAQNLFVSTKNLLVEGVSDLIILTAMSSILESANRTSLAQDITIVPTGGLEKVATFISLLRGSELEIVCMLDSFKNQKGKANLNKHVHNKIIHESKIHFFDEFIDNLTHADLEDLFTINDYLKLFNSAFTEHNDILESSLKAGSEQIILQINKLLNLNRFNHYLPANELIKIGADGSFFDVDTLDRFEKMFKVINKNFSDEISA